VIKITKINSILELLSEKELTSLEISGNLGIVKDVLYPKLSRLKGENRIIITNDKKPYKYKAITPKALLKQLYNIMVNKMIPKERLNEFESNTINIVERLINHE